MVPVYPRWRGEHFFRLRYVCINLGLSPLVRGTHPLSKAQPVYVRFIPAGAGNTIGGNAAREIEAVYPRWRGEHADSLYFSKRRAGLSPLARGTRVSRQFHGLLLRFIPAGAGNTYQEQKKTLLIWVYPRWRGEHSR